MTKAEALELIRTNIATYGHHLYLVQGGPDPRYIYSIGLRDAIGAELIFAGAAFYSANEGFEREEKGTGIFTVRNSCQLPLIEGILRLTPSENMPVPFSLLFYPLHARSARTN